MRAAMMCLALLLLVGCSNPVTPTAPPQNPTPPPAVTPTPPTASINSISPASATAGSSDVVVTIGGSHFVHDGFRHTTFAIWFGSDGQSTGLGTNFVSSSQLTATIPSALLAKPVTARIDVFTGDVMNDYHWSPSTEAKTFTVLDPNR